jgi:rhodanese-related sulfurtransferase
MAARRPDLLISPPENQTLRREPVSSEDRSMSQPLDRQNVRDLTPEDVARGLTEGRILLVDVREPRETDMARYPEAVLMPMSAFDPTALPDPGGRQVVFACASGVRSVNASLAAQAAGLPYDAHLAGGLKAWMAAGLPTEP